MSSADTTSAGPTWRADELFGRGDWRVELTSSEVDELWKAAEPALDEGDAGPSDTAIELPLLSARASTIGANLEHGSGTALVRGLGPLVARLAREGDRGLDAIGRLFRMFSACLGTAVSQTAHGERLLAVRDAALPAGDPRVRGPLTNRRLGFHTDRCDVIAFLCVRPALEGGWNDVVSSQVLAHELARRHPEAWRILQQPFVYLRHTIDSENAPRFVRQPIFSEYEGHFAASFLRVLIDRADRTDGVPSCSPEQRAALDTLDEVADDPALYARLRLEPGDVWLVNNWVCFHRRTEFADAPEVERKRLLLRLWLSVPNSRPLHPSFAANFGATGAGEVRGGIRPQA